METSKPVVASTVLSQTATRRSANAVFVSLLVGLSFSLLYWQGVPWVVELFPASSKYVFQEGQWWRLWTCIVIHADLKHLLSNAVLFVILCAFIYGHFGWVAYPVVALFVGGVATVLTLLHYSPEVQLIGASGLVYVLAGFWLTMYFLIQRQYSLPNRLLRSAGFALAMLFPTTFQENISYRVHLYGALLGVPWGALHFWLMRKEIRSKETFRPVEEDPPV